MAPPEIGNRVAHRLAAAAKTPLVLDCLLAILGVAAMVGAPLLIFSAS